MPRGSRGGIGSRGGKKSDGGRNKRTRDSDRSQQEELPKKKRKSTRGRTSKETGPSPNTHLAGSEPEGRTTEQPSFEDELGHHKSGKPSRPRCAPKTRKPTLTKTRPGTARSLYEAPAARESLLEFQADQSSPDELQADTPSLPSDVKRQASLAHNDNNHLDLSSLPHRKNKRTTKLLKGRKEDHPAGNLEPEVPSGAGSRTHARQGSLIYSQPPDLFDHLEMPQPIRTNYVKRFLANVAADLELSPPPPPLRRLFAPRVNNEDGRPGGIEPKEVGRLHDETKTRREPTSKPRSPDPVSSQVEDDPFKDFQWNLEVDPIPNAEMDRILAEYTNVHVDWDAISHAVDEVALPNDDDDVGGD
ncbi:uncharacterized protein F4807DRAFT_16586 [Annulohypoxylon truncatum]|uniref:uncharacterized protein n=1 Tax=Annulohypoxylon truncatum TaxID=327061 RepID=UPI0020073B6A|nr:uncharacterized protein F4807DRAFT_16586 [Annulohypoxylon truncatum]KAI1214989.1 hypothetical protein F4807DRAFT_16586 [Annulohypoxylon truncatum]